MTATSDGYYAMLDARHQSYIDGLAAWITQLKKKLKA